MQQLKAGYMVAINCLFLRDLIPPSSFRGHHVCTWYKDTTHRQNTQTCESHAKVHFPSGGLGQHTHLQTFSAFVFLQFVSAKER